MCVHNLMSSFSNSVSALVNGSYLYLIKSSPCLLPMGYVDPSSICFRKWSSIDWPLKCGSDLALYLKCLTDREQPCQHSHLFCPYSHQLSLEDSEGLTVPFSVSKIGPG